MGKRKTFGDGIGSGKACILVKEKGLGDGNHGSYISLAEKEQKRVLYLTEKEGELSDEGFGSLSFCKRCYGEGSKETGRDDRSRRMDEKNR